VNESDGLAPLLERLRRLEDLEQIRQLYIDYGRHLDAGDADAYAALFASDAKLRLGPVMRADGQEDIRRAAAATIGRSAESGRRSVHVLGSPRVELDGDRATGECVWAAIPEPRDGSQTVLVGRHLDELVRENGRWRFAQRRGLIDIGGFQ
jgi:uncharacterized protein (TIGR02246 family)